MYEKLRKLNLKRRFSLRTALMASLTLALLVLATVFMTVSASDDVTPSDVSPTSASASYRIGGHSRKVSPTDVSASDGIMGVNNVSPIDTCSDPETLGEPVVTMTTAKAVGESLEGMLSFEIAGNNVFVDYGDNKPVAYPGEKTVKGKTIKIYGDNITELYLCENKLTSLNVSKPADLMTLWCDNNQLTSINLSGCSSLTQLYCTNNQLSSIDVSDCNSLIKLYCSDNQLTTLDASACSALVEIVCTNNQLTSLTVPNPEDELFVSCDNNRLTIPQVYTIDKSANVHLADYAPQMHVIPSAIKVGESIDLSSEYSVDGTASEFVWYDSDENVITPATANGGVFTFGDDAVGKTLVCKMTNAKLPEFMSDVNVQVDWNEEVGDIYEIQDHRLTTTEVTIEAAEPVLGDPVITMTTSKAVGESMDGNLTFDIAGNNVFVDYGDNKPVAYPGEKTVKGKTIKIYGDNITELYLCENKLTSLNVSKPADLMTLWCDNNQLTSINLSGCSSLTQLYCTNNQLSSIDVSDCNSLIKLYCSDNQLTTLDASACSALVEIVCTNNQLTSLTVPNPEDELFVSCDNNRLTIPQVYTIDKSANVHLADYAPQMHVIPSAIKVGESIDLSSEYSVDGTASEFVWYDSDENVITPATANGGVFTFGEDAAGKTLVCKMTNAKLPDFCEGSGEYPEWDENGNETGNMIPYEYDNRLFTTEVAIEAKDPEEPVSSDDSVSSQENEDVQGDPVIYYDLAFKQDENVDGVSEVLYPERTMISINGMGVDLHSVKGVHLTVGNIETNTKKTVLDAIKHYNETFDTETTDIALYDISLEDKNNVHVKVVAGEILICLKYPDNLARQAEDYVFHLYHQKADGTIEEIPVTIRRNGIWFRATDFSPYVLYWHVKTVESAGTGESFSLIIVMTVLCALSVAGAGYALYRRKKLTAE